jgi:hypothetical protein
MLRDLRRILAELRHPRLILAVSDGEQSVFDEGDYRIGRIGLREGAGGEQRARVLFRHVRHMVI